MHPNKNITVLIMQILTRINMFNDTARRKVTLRFTLFRQLMWKVWIEIILCP